MTSLSERIELIEAAAKEAADAVGVTPHSDMRPFVEQAVKYALARKAEALEREVAEKDARIAALEEALRPLAEIADVFDHSGGNRPTQGIVAAWSDHRFGERELTVEALRRARTLLNGGSDAQG